MDAGILIGVVIAERAGGIDVLHHNPDTVTACIVCTAGQALMHDDEVFGRAVDLDLDDTANGLCAQFYVCHCYLLAKNQTHGKTPMGLVFCETVAVMALCCFL